MPNGTQRSSEDRACDRRIAEAAQRTNNHGGSDNGNHGGGAAAGNGNHGVAAGDGGSSSSCNGVEIGGVCVSADMVGMFGDLSNG